MATKTFANALGRRLAFAARRSRRRLARIVESFETSDIGSSDAKLFNNLQKFYSNSRRHLQPWCKMSARYVLIDNWKTHFGAPQNYPAICEVRENQHYYPIWFLESTPIEQTKAVDDNNDVVPRPTTATSSTSTTANSTVKKAVDTARSLFSVKWCRFSGETPPVRPVLDENASVLELGDARIALQFVTPTPVDKDVKYFDHVEQLQIEKIAARHLIGCVMLEYELFGGEHSFVADFATGSAEGFCAIDASRNQIVGHTIYEIENNTIVYTSFANTDYWRGRGVAKAMVSELMKHIFRQTHITHGRMHVRGGHAEVVGLYRHYGFDIIATPPDVEQEFYEDGQPMVIMGGPLKFDVFGKRLGWIWKTREAFLESERKTNNDN